MTSLFFRLLPADLHIDILSTWIDASDNGFTLIRALSALDVACSKSDQPAFRSLVSTLPPFGDFSPSKNVINHVINFIQWLDSRKVPLKTLMLSAVQQHTAFHIHYDGKPMVLPHVRTVIFRDHSLVSNNFLATVFGSCPHLTTLDCNAKNFLMTSSLVEQLPNLTNLTLTGPSNNNTQSLIQGVGPHLHELHLSGTELTSRLQALIAQHCPMLRVFEVATNSARAINKILESCADLAEVGLYGVELTATSLVDIASKPQIRRLTVHTAYAFNAQHCEVFASTLELRPDLEYLRVGQFMYHPAEGVLEVVTKKQLHASIVNRILNVCTSISDLRVFPYFSETNFDLNVAFLIGERLGGRLASLRMVASDLAFVAAILRSNPLLTRLQVDGDAHETILLIIAEQCKQLETLLIKAKTSPNSGDCMTILVKNCPHLKDLTVSFPQPDTVSLFKDILYEKLPLKRLAVMNCAMEEQWFREQARDRQQLPVPTIVVNAGEIVLQK